MFSHLYFFIMVWYRGHASSHMVYCTVYCDDRGLNKVLQLAVEHMCQQSPSHVPRPVHHHVCPQQQPDRHLQPRLNLLGLNTSPAKPQGLHLFLYSTKNAPKHYVKANVYTNVYFMCCYTSRFSPFFIFLLYCVRLVDGRTFGFSF